MSTVTPPVELGTAGDWDYLKEDKKKDPSRDPLPDSPDESTAPSELERPQADIRWIGGADPVTDIVRSPDRFLLLEELVEYCVQKPSQDKIECGADVLSQTGNRLVQYLDDVRLQAPGADRDARVWLFAEAVARLPAPGADVLAALRALLDVEDSSIRETVANALGRTGDAAAVGPLRRALASEHDAAAREAMEDAIEQLGG